LSDIIFEKGFSKMKVLKRTALNEKHRSLGATMIDFNGWDMPLYYSKGIVEEHLATRKKAGLFDISHMGRFILRGPGALGVLNHVLTNNAGALRMGVAEMTRFGMREESFRTLAGLIHDVVVNNAKVIDQVKALRKDFQELGFSFKGEEFTGVVEKLRTLI